MDRISELIEDDGLFESNGFAVVKITKNGKEKLLELPIKSTGVADFQAELRNSAPKPPVRREVVKKESAEGKKLGLTHDRLLQVFDNTDEAYITALEEHNQNFIWRVIIFALDLKLKKKDGEIASTFAEKKKVLKSNGLASSHAEQIFKDVQALTKINVDGEDFL